MFSKYILANTSVFFVLFVLNFIQNLQAALLHTTFHFSASLIFSSSIQKALFIASIVNSNSVCEYISNHIFQFFIFVFTRLI